MGLEMATQYTQGQYRLYSFLILLIWRLRYRSWRPSFRISGPELNCIIAQLHCSFTNGTRWKALHAQIGCADVSYFTCVDADWFTSRIQTYVLNVEGIKDIPFVDLP